MKYININKVDVQFYFFVFLLLLGSSLSSSSSSSKIQLIESLLLIDLNTDFFNVPLLFKHSKSITQLCFSIVFEHNSSTNFPKPYFEFFLLVVVYHCTSIVVFLTFNIFPTQNGSSDCSSILQYYYIC